MAYQPAQWLLNLAKVSPTPYWPWRHSLRLTLITTVPMTIGFMTGQVVPAMIICLGGLLTGIAVQTDPYPARFRRIFISTPIGMSGYLIGTMIGGHGIWTIFYATFVALLSGLISGYGAAFSGAALQMLTMMIVASHAHSDAPIWVMPLCFMFGALYAAFLLAVESILSPNLPERQILATLFNAMSQLARAAINAGNDTATFENAMRNVTSAQSKAYSALMQKQLNTDGRSVSGDWSATILSITDRTTALLTTRQTDAAVYQQASDQLEALSKAVLKPNQANTTLPQPPNNDPLLYNIFRISSGIKILDQPDHTWLFKRLVSFCSSLLNLNYKTIKPRLHLGRAAILTAVKLALCILIAMFIDYFSPENRSYWIPLSVAVILKPDFGSVFVRSVQRCAGTFVGVLIASAIFIIVPKDLSLVLIIAVLSALLPWAALKNYAFQCTFLTPLILILIDLIIAGPTANYGEQRLIDTLIGAGIVLIFGYALWPQSTNITLKQNFSTALLSIAEYLRSTQYRKENPNDTSTPLFNETAEKRRAAYAALSDLRVYLQRCLSEPPPSSTEALSWLPAISAAERICDHVTSFALLCEDNKRAQNSEIVQLLIELMESIINNEDNKNIIEKIDLIFKNSTQNLLEKNSLIDIYRDLSNIKDKYLCFNKN